MQRNDVTHFKAPSEEPQIVCCFGWSGSPPLPPFGGGLGSGCTFCFLLFWSIMDPSGPFQMKPVLGAERANPGRSVGGNPQANLLLHKLCCSIWEAKQMEAQTAWFSLQSVRFLSIPCRIREEAGDREKLGTFLRHALHVL